MLFRGSITLDKISQQTIAPRHKGKHCIKSCNITKLIISSDFKIKSLLRVFKSFKVIKVKDDLNDFTRLINNNILLSIKLT